MKRLFILILLLLFPLQTIAVETTEIADEIYVSASFKDTSLVEALENLSDQTGYNFVIPEEWSEARISGQFVQEDLHKFFKRSFKNSNFSLIIDEDNKTVIVKDLGGGSKIQEPVETTMVAKAIDPESGMLKKDLQDLHNTQMMEMAQQEEHPNGIDPMSGMTNGVLREQRQKQMAEYEKAVQDGSVIDPMSGMPLAELNRLREQQMAEFNK